MQDEMAREGLWEEVFEKFLNYDEYSRNLAIFSTYLGICLILICAVRFFFAFATGLRLYLIAQIPCCQTDFVERYGKWALVTGATDGIGQSIAKELAARGMSILVVGRNPAKLEFTKSLLEAIPNVGQVETVQIDQSDPSLKNYERIRAQIDPMRRDIGILVNNAGIYPDTFQRFNNYQMDALISLVNVNILGPVHMVRMIMPAMIQRGRGLVVNVSSVSNFTKLPYFGLYIPSKTFLGAFTQQLQVEYASHPIDLILLTPGPVFTNTFGAATKMSANPFSPKPDDYARSAVNALSARCKHCSGTIVHGFIHLLLEFGEYFSIGLNYVWLMGLSSGVKSFNLSPIPKRKRLTLHGGEP